MARRIRRWGILLLLIGAAISLLPWINTQLFGPKVDAIKLTREGMGETLIAPGQVQTAGRFPVSAPEATDTLEPLVQPGQQVHAGEPLARFHPLSANDSTLVVLIPSPADGVVLKLNTLPGQQIQPGDPVLLMAAQASPELLVQVEGSRQQLLRVGMPALIYADTFPDQPFAATVVSLKTAPGATRLKLESRNLPAFLEEDMIISAELALGQRQRTLSLPSAAVHGAHGSSWVWQLVDRYARRKEVRAGHDNGRQVEILSGLRPGDVIILGGSHISEDGQRVRARLQQPRGKHS